MVRLFRWLCGYVVFSFSRGYVEGFMNSCYEQGIAVRDIRREDKSTLTGECGVIAYLRLHRVARRNGGVVYIVSRHGPLFFFLDLRRRLGLLAGGLAFVFIISYFSGFIWSIDVVGNSEITDQQIISFLADNGFAVGSYWNSVDRDRLESLMMASFDKCAWVHINKNGTSASVEINETVDTPPVVDTDVITNLKATKDGIIVQATVYDGWQVAKVGDSVVQGDLLISGVYESEEGKRNIFAHARGEYIAQVCNDFELVVNRQQSVRSYEPTREYRTLSFFGVDIPLYIGSSFCINSDDTISVDYITIYGHTLPIGLITKTVRPYSLTTTVLDDKHLNELVQREIERQIKRDYSQCEVVSRDIDIELAPQCARAVGTVHTLEDIGKEQKLK